MNQIKEVVKIVEFKYPKKDGWKIVWIFDHSSCNARRCSRGVQDERQSWWQAARNARWIVGRQATENVFQSRKNSERNAASS